MAVRNKKKSVLVRQPRSGDRLRRVFQCPIDVWQGVEIYRAGVRKNGGGDISYGLAIVDLLRLGLAVAKTDKAEKKGLNADDDEGVTLLETMEQMEGQLKRIIAGQTAFAHMTFAMLPDESERRTPAAVAERRSKVLRATILKELGDDRNG